MVKVVHQSNNNDKTARHPFRQAVFRGLGVVVPPLLTILIFLWVISTTHRYVLEPVTVLAREALLWVWIQPEVIQRKDLPPAVRRWTDLPSDPGVTRENRAVEVNGRKYQWADSDVLLVDNRRFQRLEDNEYVTFIPEKVYEVVLDNQGKESLPRRGLAYYRRFVEVTYLRPQFTIPFFLAVFLLALYLLGKLMAAGIGRFFWFRFERGVHRLPLVSSVYSSVKQVSDFLFSEPEIEYNRVVAVEYPRKGIWSLALVTGDSMLDIRAAANEPVLSVLIPTSPMPMTGFTVTVRKSETIDLNITIEQAFQFIVSCGVVVPPQQMEEMAATPEALPAPAAAQAGPSGDEARA